MWAKAIYDQTTHYQRITCPCEASFDFCFPKNKYPKDLPHGPDLDNCLKFLLDELQKTILENDSLIVKLHASKRKAKVGESCGVNIKIKPIARGSHARK